MEVIFSNVGCSILASIIYDISKVCLGKVTCKNAEHSIKKIEELMRAKLDDKYGDLYMSGVFQEFLRAPVFKDTIEHYTIYKITGKREGNICEVKKNNHIILEKDVIDFLVNYLFEQYSDEVSKPSKTLAYQFFNDFFIISEDYFVTLMKDEDKPAVFFVNEKMDLMQEHLLSKFGELAEIIKRMMKCDIVPVKNEYEDYVKEYHKILKANYSRAHVYLLDTIDFADFYVPPSLRRHTFGKEEEEKRWVIRQTVSKFFHIELENEKEDSLDDWKHIFDDNGIVYVTGGAGYGKSLFLKKLINDYSDMNILNSQEYLVIYGDLKAFYVEGEQPVSVVRFLQNSMVKETLMDEKHFPVEMIEYYIKTGRCLILLDALDEVEKRKREELHKRIIAYFKNQNPNNKICITSRNRGFIPEKDVEVFDILPLGRRQIEAYVDNIVKLGRFDLKDKKLFLEQTDILVKKGFLNSFLILSLLINIYKAERELPENKVELYQKCFDYIAYRREKEKTKAKVNWDLISCLMKDNTFMELAKMCFPNNRDIGKAEIVDMLCGTYCGKYTSGAEAERAAEQFLAFCSDRTELFVPAAGEDRFKFFHRSFFEYFYAQYIFLRIRDANEVYDSLQKFDVDSEIFELTLAMMKQKDELRYQELMEYIFAKAGEEIKEKGENSSAFNILTLSMQVADDAVYLKKYMDYLAKNSGSIIKNIEKIPNQTIIYNLISDHSEYAKKMINAYEAASKWGIIKVFLEQFSEMEEIACGKKLQEIPEDERKYYPYRFRYGYGNSFYMKLYINNMDYSNIMDELSESKLEQLMIKCKIPKKTREKYSELYLRFKELETGEQKKLQTMAFSTPHKNISRE